MGSFSGAMDRPPTVGATPMSRPSPKEAGLAHYPHVLVWACGDKISLWSIYQHIDQVSICNQHRF
jgi:hypothetical protein